MEYCTRSKCVRMYMKSGWRWRWLCTYCAPKSGRGIRIEILQGRSSSFYGLRLSTSSSCLCKEISFVVSMAPYISVETSHDIYFLISWAELLWKFHLGPTFPPTPLPWHQCFITQSSNTHPQIRVHYWHRRTTLPPSQVPIRTRFSQVQGHPFSLWGENFNTDTHTREPSDQAS